MATIDLGKIKLVNRGAYNNSTAYTVDDLVQSGGSTYICIQDSTGNAVTNNSYWSVLAQGGTDVGTTITTQGDLLYRDGSGLQRLAKGTASQVLKMNTAANAPEWGNLSSDFVKLAETDISSATASVIYQNGTNGVVIDNTYRGYMIKVSNCQPYNAGEVIRFQVGVGGTIRTSGYFQEAHRSYYSGGTDRANATGTICTFRGGAEHSVHGEIHCAVHFSDMTDASCKTSAFGTGVIVDGNASATNQVNQGTSGGIYGTAEANDTIKIYMASGDILKGQFTLYGLK